MLFFIVKRRLLIGRRLFCSRGWRRKQCPGARRQQRRRQPGKIRTLLALADGETRLREGRGANISGPVGSLMRAAFGKSEEMTTGRPEVSGCRQFFVVPNANWNRRHEEMIRIDGEKGEKGEFAVNSFYLGRKVMRGGREPPCITFFIYPYDADVVLHPRQSLDFSSRGTTSPGSTGQSASPTWCFTLAKVLILRRRAPRRRARLGNRRLRRGASSSPKP